ncbi:MAG: GAF domain-containing protein [Bacteroidales bacterium]|nr:GAF domain-containing protein [Bacteroidales bacterium]
MKFRIQTKLLVYILSTSSLIYLLAFGYLSISDYKASTVEAKKLTDTYAEKYANNIMNELNSDLSIARTLVQSFSQYKSFYSANKQTIYYEMLRNVLEKNPQFHNVALNFELSEIDKKYNKDYGRLRFILYKSSGLILTMIDTLELDGDNVGGPYYDMKINPREEYSEPYLFSPTGSNVDQTLVSSLSVPIMDENRYVGLLQFDVNLERFKAMVNEIRPYPGSHGFLLSNKGAYIAIPDENIVGKSIEKMIPEENLEQNIMGNIRAGKIFSYLRNESDESSNYVSYYPLKFGNAPAYWSLGISVPYKVMIQKAQKNLNFSILVAIIGFLILALVIWLISRGISKPLIKTADTIKTIAKGNISSNLKLPTRGRDEITDINNSVNTLIDGLENNLKFALQIGRGNLEYNFELTSKNDVLGKALLDMRKSLKQAAADEDNRKKIDLKLNWATKGFAQFGELMRENTDKLSEFSYNIISNLVRYLNGSQGGLFIINDARKEDIFVELSASYAYDRRKYLEKKIKMGVGLVGRCINEMETIYMTDFPDDYMNISSGLGQATPKCLLLVPIVFNQQVFGVIEMASFREMEQYQIDFVERIGESIGSTISNVKMNEQTATLLAESKIQSEELVAQEEEMRQNLEEMKATQEELERKAMDYEGIINALNAVTLVAEFDMQGRLIEINRDFLKLLNKSKDEMIGTFQGAFAVTKEDRRNVFRDFWNDLRRGMIKKTIQHLVIKDKDIWLSEAYTPIYDKDGNPYKVLNISVDITESMQQNVMEN